MPVFYIFRHGETFATRDGTGYGQSVFSAPILEEGKPALRKLGKFLKGLPTDFNVSSEIKRCRQTVEIVSKESNKAFVFDKRLNEFFLESFEEFKNRLEGVLKDVESKDYHSVCVCSHGACIAMLVQIITSKPYKSLEFLDYPDPGVLIIIEGNVIKEEINFNTSNS